MELVELVLEELELLDDVVKEELELLELDVVWLVFELELELDVCDEELVLELLDDELDEELELLVV